MKEVKDYSDIVNMLEKQNDRIAGIERLLKITLVDNILRDINEISSIGECGINEEFLEMTSRHGLIAGKLEIQNGIRVQNITVPKGCKISVSKMIDLRNCFISDAKGLVVCFQFESLNGMQRKRLLVEQVSFCVKSREIHIFADRTK